MLNPENIARFAEPVYVETADVEVEDVYVEVDVEGADLYMEDWLDSMAEVQPLLDEIANIDGETITAVRVFDAIVIDGYTYKGDIIAQW